MNWKWMIFGLLAICFACSNGQSKRTEEMQRWKEQNGRVKVLSTIAMINDLVKVIGGEFVDTLTLVQGELDPHSYQLVKGDDEKLMTADLIFYNGLGLEHGPSLQHHLHNNEKAIPLGNLLQKQMPDRILDYNGQLDPHIWTDISLWAESVPYIVDALAEKDPSHADQYRLRGEKLRQELLEEHQQIRQDLQDIPEERRYLVTSHDAFNYFARAYLATDEERDTNRHWQKRFAAPEGLAPDSQLSTTDIQTIIDHVAKHNISVLFPESNVSKDSIRKIINATKDNGLKLEIADDYLYADAMGGEGSNADTYVKMMRHNASTIRKWLTKDQGAR
jgi:manganese/zinc/iron transport system substrate-binding protein